MKVNNPLVSIVVITYNSAEYVLETLESAKNQTYKNIELIISDDGSMDSTAEVCEKWLDRNHERFVRVKVINVKKNTGIPANCNRGLYAAKGKWVKFIAGDDVLFEDCIRLNVDNSKDCNCPVLVSDLFYFNENGKLENDKEQRVVFKNFISKSQKRKKQSYIRNPFFLNTPSFFINTKRIKELGGFDERFFLLEDLPFLIKLLTNGDDIHYFEEYTVKYRVHSTSVVGASNLQFVKDLYNSYLIYSRPLFSRSNAKDIIFKFYNDVNFHFRLNKKEHTLIYKVFNKASGLLRKIN